jgi:hypothetical protein
MDITTYLDLHADTAYEREHAFLRVSKLIGPITGEIEPWMPAT